MCQCMFRLDPSDDTYRQDRQLMGPISAAQGQPQHNTNFPVDDKYILRRDGADRFETTHSCG